MNLKPFLYKKEQREFGLEERRYSGVMSGIFHDTQEHFLSIS